MLSSQPSAYLHTYIHAYIRSHFGSSAQTLRVATPRPRTAGCLPDAFQEPRRSCSPHLVVGLLPAARSGSVLLYVVGLLRAIARRRPASPSPLDASSNFFFQPRRSCSPDLAVGLMPAAASGRPWTSSSWTRTRTPLNA